jgi:hypothetical protein
MPRILLAHDDERQESAMDSPDLTSSRATPASNVLASAASDATISLTSLHLWGRALRRQRMVRDLEVFLAIEVGGWPLKSNQAIRQRSSVEAGRAFASS